MRVSNPVLFDTNILVASLDLDSPNFETAQKLHNQVEEGEIQGVIAQQNLVELLAITTDPKRVRTPLPPDTATEEVEKYLSSKFQLISPKEDTIFIFTSLLGKKGVKGQKVFDVYLLATMLSNGIKDIYTINVKDFTGYAEIKVKNPLSIDN